MTQQDINHRLEEIKSFYAGYKAVGRNPSPYYGLINDAIYTNDDPQAMLDALEADPDIDLEQLLIDLQKMKGDE